MIYRFGQYQLDIPRRQLLYDGEPVALRPKVFALLALLIERRDQVVDRDTLFTEIWPGRVVSDATLSSCIKELRKALDDNGAERRFIGTVHGQGFRFIALVNEKADTETPALVNEPSEPSPPPSSLQSDASIPQRKTVSALRCALLEADATANRLGPEGTHRLMQALLKEVSQSVERYGGHVTQWLSDGCLALFGTPLTHDDDARRAVHAASDLLKRCSTIRHDHSIGFACAVTSGIAVVGGVPGGPSQHYSASGVLLRHAERLCFAASDGDTIIDSVTYALVRGDVRAQLFTGLLQPSESLTLESSQTNTNTAPEAWRVTSIVGTRAGVPRRFRQSLTPMVGRERELALLQERFADALTQRGQGVTLVGPAGIGKTRLLDEFCTRQATAMDSQISIVTIRCLPEWNYESDFLLKQCATALATDSSLAEAAGIAGIRNQNALVLLQGLISQAPELPLNSSSLSPQAQREIMENALIQLVFSSQGVRVLLVEDLQWIDASSATWLGRLVQRMGNQRFLLLASYRTGTSPDWLRHAGVTQLPLAPISESNALKLLRALPGPRHDSVAQKRIARSSGGNPFLLSELALQESDSGSLPVTIRAVLSARIDELSAIDKQVLQSASVLGIRIDIPLLNAVCGLTSEQLRDTLERLQGRELLDIEFNAGEERLVFHHALVQEAAYGMLLSEERQRIHQRVVSWIDSTVPNARVTIPEVVARHCEEAGYRERAARLWQRAASQAAARCAYIETTGYVQRSLALLSPDPKVAPSDGQNSAPRNREEVELELLLMNNLGHAQMATHGYASTEVEKTWSRAEALCEELGDEVSLFRVLIGRGNYHLASGEVARTVSINRRLVQIARRESDTAMRIRARAAMGELMLHLGRIDSSISHFETCLSLIGGLDRLNFLGNSAAVLAHTHLAWARAYTAQNSAALVHSEQALAIAHASDKPILLAMALGMNAKLHRFRNDAARAAKLAQETIQIAKLQRFAYWHGSALVTLGWSQASNGETSRGIASIEKGIARVSDTGERLMQPIRLSALADAQHKHGQPDTAAETLSQAFRLAHSSGERFCLNELQRVERSLNDSTPANAGGG